MTGDGISEWYQNRLQQQRPDADFHVAYFQVWREVFGRFGLWDGYWEDSADEEEAADDKTVEGLQNMKLE